MSHTIESFEDLDCYKLAREFRQSISALAQSLPKREEYLLKDQMLRASRSICANIAEGFGRQHPQENLQFCRQARGSLMEMLEHLNVCLDEEFTNQANYLRLRAQRSQVRGVLGGYIKYLGLITNRDKRFKP